MPVKITVSYTPDCEGIAEQIEPRLKDILPPYKLKKDTDKPPYFRLFFNPKNGGKSTVSAGDKM